MVFITISAFIPIENAFVTFPTPEAAYTCSNSGTVKLVIEGEETDFVIGANADTNVYAIIPKSAGGWKVGRAFRQKKLFKLQMIR